MISSIPESIRKDEVTFFNHHAPKNVLIPTIPII